MANTVAPLIGESWARETQIILHKSLVGLEIASSALKADLKFGDTIHQPRYSTIPSAVAYTPGTAITVQDWATTDEYLTVDQKYVVPYYIDDVNELFFDYNAQATLAEESAYKLRDTIDQDVLAEYANAAQTEDDGDLGGTAGSAITASSANIIQIFSMARKLLRDKNVPEQGDYFAVVSSSTAEIIERTAADKGFQVADSTLRNGYAGNFLGFQVYISPNLSTGTYGGTSSVYHLFGKKGAIDFVLKKDVTTTIKDVQDKLGSNFFVWTVWGVKTFTNKADYLLSVPIAA